MDKLHRFAKKFIKTRCFANLKVRQSKENSFEFNRNIIRLNLRDDDDLGFMRHLRECHRCKFRNISSMLWTILHEVGHYATQNNLTLEEEEESYEIKAICAVVPSRIAEKSTKIQDLYFNTPIEWEATEWAIRWVFKNYCLARYYSKRLEALR